MSFHPWQSLPSAHGGPAGTGRIRERPEDFRVEEVLGFEPDGAGEHLFLHLRQTGCNTGWVAGRLARWGQRPRADVGYAGLKDRHAVTEQWFSVRFPGGRHPDPESLEIPGVEVVGWGLHGRKLRPGALSGNRFGILVRGVQADPEMLSARLEAVSARGVPNVFGPQRFGRDLNNLVVAERWFAGGPAPARAQRGFALSAARSLIFNELAAERVAAGTWDSAGAGEPVQLDGTASWFIARVEDVDLPARLSGMDVHPTGPLWGRGEPPGEGPGAALERAVAGRHQLLADGLAAAGMDQARRALRTRVSDLTWRIDGNELELGFVLPAGSYATSVLRELLECEEPAPQRVASST